MSDQTPLLAYELFGLHAGMVTCFVQPPIGYVAKLHIPPNVTVQPNCDGLLDLICYFVTSLYDLDVNVSSLKGHLKPEGRLWICWPNAESGAETDLDDGKIQQVLGKNTMERIRLTPVDDVWMGMECKPT